MKNPVSLDDYLKFLRPYFVLGTAANNVLSSISFQAIFVLLKIQKSLDYVDCIYQH